jgi:hypothetical protein
LNGWIVTWSFGKSLPDSAFIPSAASVPKCFEVGFDFLLGESSGGRIQVASFKLFSTESTRIIVTLEVSYKMMKQERLSWPHDGNASDLRPALTVNVNCLLDLS